MAVPYVESTDVLESRGRVFVGDRRVTATDYRRLRRGLDKAVAHLEATSELPCLCYRIFTYPEGVGFCAPCEARQLLDELRATGVVR